MLITPLFEEAQFRYVYSTTFDAQDSAHEIRHYWAGEIKCILLKYIAS